MVLLPGKALLSANDDMPFGLVFKMSSAKYGVEETKKKLCKFSQEIK